MRLCPLASGSSGNCIYVGSDTTHILVDIGISGKKVEAGITELQISPAEIDAILITHEHSDHIQGLGVFSRRYNIPIFATAKTIDAVRNCSSLGNIDEELFNSIIPDEKFCIKDVSVYPFRISHDAAEPVSYCLSEGAKKVGMVTDLGCYTDYTVECLKGSDILYVEANHDVNMLQVGPYPYPLKQRILGDRGHLSNENCGRLLSRLLHDDIKSVMLGHLSKENNLPELAYEAVRTEITLADNKYRGDDFPIYVAKRSEISKIIEI